MKTVSFNNQSYEVDDQNFLVDPAAWDENFAAGMAVTLGMEDGLTDLHWQVIRFIRDTFRKKKVCPLVYKTCQKFDLSSARLKELFPTGYLRGACLLAGISYVWLNYYGNLYPAPAEGKPGVVRKPPEKDKTYRITALGFLADPDQWDEAFAANRAYELNVKGGLTERHWQIIYFMRRFYAKAGRLPTVYECCSANQIDMDELKKLFPAGYHRGVVKISGLPSIFSQSPEKQSE